MQSLHRKLISVTVAERSRVVVRKRRIVAVPKAMKTKRPRLATLNAEVKTRTIRIWFIRALAELGLIVRTAIVKVIVAARSKGLLTERPNRGSR
jgi:hypothetical protein